VFIFFELPLVGFLLGFGRWHGPAPIAIVSDVRRPWRTIRSLVERLTKRILITIPQDTHLQIGSLLFEGLDQIDLTGPFEVLSRIPNSTYRVFGKSIAPVRDVRGLRLTPDADLADAPQLDLLHIPGGYGQEAFMDDEELLGWVRKQAAGARSLSSPSVPVRSSAGRRGCSKVAGRRRIGRRFTCCPISAQFP
jgi:hypothetical protein